MVKEKQTYQAVVLVDSPCCPMTNLSSWSSNLKRIAKSSWIDINDSNNNSQDTTDITGGATEGSRGHPSCGWCLCHDSTPKKKRLEARS
jgi:hypothetical protein